MGRLTALLIGAIAIAIVTFVFVYEREVSVELTTDTVATTESSSANAPLSPPPAAMAAPPASTATEAIDRDEQADDSRIVGGVTAVPKEYPWIAAIGQRDEQGNVKSYCAGTLIAPQWLVTAAHCRVLAGEHAVLGRSDLATTTGSVIEIADVIPHPSYDKHTLDYDIALAQLASPVEDIEPITMIAQCEPAGAGSGAEGGTATPDPCEQALKSAGTLSIAGWGRLGETLYERPNELQRAEVKVSSHAVCVSNYAAVNRVVTPRMFCAHGTNDAGQITDACKGDSGGPMVAHNFNRTRATLVGIISKGKDCARRGYPGVYADLSKLRGWVELCMKSPRDPRSC